MPLITFVDMAQYDEDRISTLFRMFRLVHELKDAPQVWKLTEPFLEAIRAFKGLKTIDQVLCISFLDAGVDATRQPPYLICTESFYPLDMTLKA